MGECVSAPRVEEGGRHIHSHGTSTVTRSYCKTTSGHTGVVRDCPAVWRSKIVPIIIRELSRRQRLPRRTARRSAFIWTSSSKLAAWRVSRATRTARPVHRARSPRALRLRSQVTSCSSPDVLLTWCGVVWCAAGLWVRLLRPRMDGTDGLQRALQKSQCASSTVRSP